MQCDVESVCTGKDFMTGRFSWLKHIRDSVILYLISGRHKSIQALRRRAAVRGWFDSPILMRLMANLPLPAPFTDHVRFSWKEHTAASVLTCKHLIWPSARAGAYVRVYTNCMSVKRRACQFQCCEVRLFSHVAFNLNPHFWQVDHHGLRWTLVC